jgi:hypothetical protein
MIFWSCSKFEIYNKYYILCLNIYYLQTHQINIHVVIISFIGVLSIIQNFMFIIKISFKLFLNKNAYIKLCFFMESQI